MGGFATPVGGIATPVGGIATPVGGIAAPIGGAITPMGGIPRGMAPSPIGGANKPGPVTRSLNPAEVETEGIAAPLAISSEDEAQLPRVIMISGATRSGKSTLAASLCALLCGPGHRTKQARQGTFDRVERYTSATGTHVSVLSQDSHYRKQAPSGIWDAPEALDHDRLLAAATKEVQNKEVQYVIMEGYKLFQDARLQQIAQAANFWIDIPREVSRARRMATNNAQANISMK